MISHMALVGFVVVALSQASVLHGVVAPVGDEWAHGHGSEFVPNSGHDGRFAAASAHGAKDDWKNYNYGGHGDYAKSASYGTGGADGHGNAYDNGYANGGGWGLARHADAYPWASSGYPWAGHGYGHGHGHGWNGPAVHGPW